MDGEDIELTEGGRVEMERGTLRVRDVGYADAGNYTCIATTAAGSDNLTHTVTVSGE